MTSESLKGPIYLRYDERGRVDRTEPPDDDEDVMIDFAADGSVVGVEVVAAVSETIAVLTKVAAEYGLDLRPLFAKIPTDRPLPRSAALVRNDRPCLGRGP